MPDSGTKGVHMDAGGCGFSFTRRILDVMDCWTVADSGQTGDSASHA
jgi:hypothetical protein